jgi:hypothetical protein
MDVWVSLPEDLGQRLRRVTEHSGWSQVLLIRTALDDYLGGIESLVFDGPPPPGEPSGEAPAHPAHPLAVRE